MSKWNAAASARVSAAKKRRKDQTVRCPSCGHTGWAHSSWKFPGPCAGMTVNADGSISSCPCGQEGKD